jgi:hypothetical protein
MRTSTRLKWTIGVPISIVVLIAYWGFNVRPTRAAFSDGGISPREILVTVIDNDGKPAPGFTMERRYDNMPLGRAQEIPARSANSDDHGQTRVAVGSHGTSEYEAEYWSGLVTHSTKAGVDSYTFFWNRFSYQRTLPKIEYVILRGDCEVMRLFEDELLRLPVVEKVGSAASVFAKQKDLVEFSGGNRIEVSRLTVKTDGKSASVVASDD